MARRIEPDSLRPAAALIVSLLALLVPAWSSASAATCAGKHATIVGTAGNDVIEAGDDDDPDVLEGNGGDDALIGARTDLHVPVNSGKSTLIGGPGSDVLVGGDPCDGDLFVGGPGNDNANFFSFTPGVYAKIGGQVLRRGDPVPRATSIGRSRRWRARRDPTC